MPVKSTERNQRLSAKILESLERDGPSSLRQLRERLDEEEPGSETFYMQVLRELQGEGLVSSSIVRNPIGPKFFQWRRTKEPVS